MLQYRRLICGVLVAVLVAGDVGRVAVAGGLPFFKRSKPKSCLEQAANEVDRLERELNQTGTVVIKAPDIWGESRLTKHRQEFERVMEKEVNGFELLLNASIRRSDQAYLANALAIQAVATGGSMEANTKGQTFVNSLTSGTIAGTPGSTDPETIANPGNTPLARTTIYTGTTGTLAQFGGFGDGKIGLEPTIKLDQMKRYLDHLNEIRRVNEGDDTSDSPGYSLNLVRIPVSLLPGEMTRAGHGAEVTITAKPHISPELLPKVYRDLVINDLVDSLGLSMVKIAEYIDFLAFETDGCRRVNGKWNEKWDKLKESGRIQYILVHEGQPIDKVNVEEARKEKYGDAGTPEMRLQSQANDLADVISSGTTLPFGGLARNARQPISSSQADPVFGKEQLLILGYEFWKVSDTNHRSLLDARSFLKDQLDAGYDYLQLPTNSCHWDNCAAIHQAVRSDDRDSLNTLRSTVEQPFKVRDKKVWVHVSDAPSPISSAAWLVLVEASLLNAQLNDDLQRVSQDPDCGCQCQGMVYEFFRPVPDDGAKQAFVSYVNCRWPVHVFALDPVVQQQNIADQYSMRREMQLALALSFASGKIGAQSMSRYARRLEIDMETIALNQTDIAFGHGSDTFGWRFTPRVQTPPFDSNLTVICRDMLRGGPNRDDLRKTWELEAGQRECVAIVLMPSFIDHMTFESRGNYFKMTDCHFDLGNCRDLTAKVAQDVRWSEQMQGLNCLLDQITCEQANFLPGEAERVRNRIEQLSRRLPMQTVHARVPNENTMGGFEMFSSGVTDMAPELIGFYGEPGVNPKEDTIVYLVGKNFSVHDTHVLAGNHDCDFSLISREVMQVRIPSGVRTAAAMRVGTKCTDPVVDCHIATPYGVSSHLEIPVLTAEEQVVAAQSWGRTEIPLRLLYTKSGDGTAAAPFAYTISTANTFSRKPHELPITVPPYGVVGATIEVKCEVIWDDGGRLLQLGTTTVDTAGIAFDPSREEYVVSGQKYRTLIQGVVTKVQENVLNAFHKQSKPPGHVDLLISGEIGGTPIAGDLHIMVQLEEAP